MIKKEGTGETLNYKLLKQEDRYSAKDFPIKKVFGLCEIDEETTIEETPWYYSIDCWEKYCNFLGSEERKELERPPKKIFRQREWYLIGEGKIDGS